MGTPLDFIKQRGPSLEFNNIQPHISLDYNLYLWLYITQPMIVLGNWDTTYDCNLIIICVRYNLTEIFPTNISCLTFLHFWPWIIQVQGFFNLVFFESSKFFHQFQYWYKYFMQFRKYKAMTKFVHKSCH